jgi:hypothetical protein
MKFFPGAAGSGVRPDVGSGSPPAISKSNAVITFFRGLTSCGAKSDIKTFARGLLSAIFCPILFKIQQQRGKLNECDN